MVKKIRADFPYLLSDQNFIYFDNAATTQKPVRVLHALTDYYTNYSASIHRGIYQRAEQATALYEQARQTVASYINAHYDEVVFTSGTTEGINAIAATWAIDTLKSGDEIILTIMEHHANIVPWIRLAQKKNLKIRYVDITQDGTIRYDQYLQLLNERTKLVACTSTSNVLGSVIDIPYMVQHAHVMGAKVLVDAAQTAPHRAIDVKQWGADFVVFGAHKMIGPSGIGALYISRSIQPYMEPYQVGGGMVSEVSLHSAQWRPSPLKYEAGTPASAQAVGFATAIDYLKSISIDTFIAHEATLCTMLIDYLATVPGVHIMGSIEQIKMQGHMVSFWHERIHAHDIAAYLDTHSIAVRAGNQCTQPLHDRLGITASVRVSFYCYNTQEEVERLIQALKKLF